ncbi:hypothetical protein BDB00DRAFT_815714 [Zychaea mexicana]|uniref:uncharacterized protein n=1 Tax=Zychaea mexicana TaxID=64656 RepID=UPI0022FE0157|nr:uncharacterized protein BDB00DRAFT_815714 [Zychaea mexicana]KAI9495064.1 hypothetical protein BDB00DRAFT_815714 [Zychaea mexicana]
MSTLKTIIQRSVSTIRSTAHNVPRHRRLTNTASLCQQEVQRSQQRQPQLKIDSPAAKANKYLYTIPQDPYVAAQRVSRIAKVASADDALEYLKCLRVGLQSTAAWNTVIKQYATQGKGSQAEKCFVQMRKRNIPPNEQTFTVLLTACAHSSSPAAIRNAQQVIDRMARYNIKPSIIHYNTLLLAYEKTQTPVQDVFKRLPCKPNEYTYSIAFRCADNVDFVKQLWIQVQQRLGNNPTEARGGRSTLAQKACQITMTEEALQHDDDDSNDKANRDDGKFTLDDRLAASFLSALAKTATEPDDIQLGVDAIEQLYGLRPTSSTNSAPAKPTSKHGLLTPTVYSLDAILRFCGRSRRYKLGREYYGLALKQYPQLVPDKALLDTRAWLDGGGANTKRHSNHRQHRQQRHSSQLEEK